MILWFEPGDVALLIGSSIGQGLLNLRAVSPPSWPNEAETPPYAGMADCCSQCGVLLPLKAKRPSSNLLWLSYNTRLKTNCPYHEASEAPPSADTMSVQMVGAVDPMQPQAMGQITAGV
jgi:hypothetical protein